MNNPFYVSRAIAAVLGLLWVHIEPSINFITVCFFALIIDCYTAWRCNRRIYQKYREEIKRNPKCKMDGKLRSKKMAKMVWTFSVLIMCICLASYLDRNILGYMNTTSPTSSRPCTAWFSLSAYSKTRAHATERLGQECFKRLWQTRPSDTST